MSLFLTFLAMLYCLGWGVACRVVVRANLDLVSRRGGRDFHDWKRPVHVQPSDILLGIALGLLWPIWVIPALGLWRLPKTEAQLEQENERQRDQIQKLERELRR